MNQLHGNEVYLEQGFRLPQALPIYPQEFQTLSSLHKCQCEVLELKSVLEAPAGFRQHMVGTATWVLSY
jgi:hypothetical protein